jgi:hypothetical protein
MPNAQCPMPNDKGKLMKTKDEYIACLTLKMKEWDAQINYLTTKVENQTIPVKFKHIKELEALRAKQRDAAEKLKELEEAKDDTWVLVARTANKVWDDLRTGIASVSYELNRAY